MGWHVADIVYLDFIKAFSIVSHNILTNKIMKYRLEKWTEMDWNRQEKQSQIPKYVRQQTRTWNKETTAKWSGSKAFNQQNKVQLATTHYSPAVCAAEILSEWTLKWPRDTNVPLHQNSAASGFIKRNLSSRMIIPLHLALVRYIWSARSSFELPRERKTWCESSKGSQKFGYWNLCHKTKRKASSVQPEVEKTQGDYVNVKKYLTRGGKEDRARLLVQHSAKNRGNNH